jgi:hypothetical protein
VTAEGTVTRRATRRNLTTQPVQRGLLGSPTAGQAIRYTPLTPAELADIITQARNQRTEADIQAYAERKAS